MDSQFDTFPDEEYQERLSRMRSRMKDEGWDACILSAPENIFYLTGLDHWGFFALHVLIVPAEGNMRLIARAMEQVTMDHQLTDNVDFCGYLDSKVPGEFVAEQIKDMGLGGSTISMDTGALYRSHKDTKDIMGSLPDVDWKDSQAFMHKLRFVKSPLEVAAMRQAGNITERMMEATLRTVAGGVNEKAIAAEVYKEMILAGSGVPSFGPFIRPYARGGEEHGTWGDEFLADDDTLFVELSGSYHRYHAPMGRYVRIKPPEEEVPAQKVCRDAFDAAAKALTTGNKAKDVFAAWRKVADDAGLKDYYRHHCGYMVGLSFPPAWAECQNRNFNLSETNELVLEAGMTFHVLSWLVGSKLGDDFISNTVLVTDKGGEVLTTTSQNTLTAN